MERAAAGRPNNERFSNLKLAFSMATYCLLTACSHEDFGAYFSFLNPYQQDALYNLYIQMVVSVQENLQEEFRDICEETRVVDACDDEFLLAQELGKNGVRERVRCTGRKNIIEEKAHELEYLRQTLEMVKEQNQDSALKLKALKDSIENSESIAQTNVVLMKLKGLSAKLGSTVGDRQKVEFPLRSSPSTSSSSC
ncbi:hypothetical protein GOP47_0008594 [Adiantum capillus-veneris]|uniref:Uncharacterized protein n=1 Tax=Adiantum capillus-veneris TaxID=13818 RepID=A0A9D4UYZ9_ADICA|nr:hypothetical protein GOP47_0008594 [Adiantum capillus-veneris]